MIAVVVVVAAAVLSKVPPPVVRLGQLHAIQWPFLPCLRIRNDC